MRAGILVEQITFLKPTTTRGDYNEEKTTYTPVIRTRAYVDHKKGNKIEVTDESFWTDIREFIVRIYHSIEPDFHILYQDNEYRILDIDEDREWQRMIIKAEKVNE